MKEFFNISLDAANRIGFIGIILICVAIVLFISNADAVLTRISFIIAGLILAYYILYTILDTLHMETNMFPYRKSLTQKQIVLSANTLLAIDSNELLKRKDHHELSRLLERLDSVREYALLGKSIAKLGENFGAVSSSVRLQAAKMFKRLTPALWSTESENIHANFNRVFINAAEQETNKEVYIELADLLEEMVHWSFETEKNFTLTKETIEMLRRHQKLSSESFPKRCELAFKTLRNIADKKAILQLVKMLKSEEKEERKSGYELTMLISGYWIRRVPKRILIKKLSGIDYSIAEKIIAQLQKK